MDSKKLIECPICFKNFDASTIENHVGKCLFLQESINETKLLKRPPSSSTDEKIIKKSKYESKDNSALGKCDYSKQKKSEDERVKQEQAIPLAEKLRPTDIITYVGQSHIIGPQSALYQLLQKNEIPNIILWGPPGCGKTSLANVIASMCKSHPKGIYRFVKLSAAVASSNDVKEAIMIASNELKFGCRSIIFLDEIHRFNKIQQDLFLPYIESGTITLIGATTENPSFSLNPALLSRCRVIVLEKLTNENIVSILEKAVRILQGSLFDSSREGYMDTLNSSMKHTKFFIDKSTVEWLSETADGDARIALGGLELAIKSKVPTLAINNEVIVVSLNDIKENLKKTHMLYDKKGDQHYDLISALHKSVRASNENASLYWLTRMIAGGEDPVYIARRLVRMACEDVGLADAKALGIAVHTMQLCKILKMNECNALLAQCTVYLARTDKSRLMENALRAAQRFISNHHETHPSVPLYLRNISSEYRKKFGCDAAETNTQKCKTSMIFLPKGIAKVDFLEG